VKQIKFLLILKLLFTGIAGAATYNITGTVIKSGGGPLKDVTISLAKIPGVTATTDSDGKFLLLSPSHAIETKQSQGILPGFGITGRDIVFYTGSGIQKGNIAIFSGNGKQMVSVDINDITSEKHRLTLPHFAAGFAILRVTLNDKVYTYPIIQTANSIYIKESGSKNITLNKMMTDTIVDTLIARKNGFSDKKTPIKSYVLADISISMDSIIPPTICNATTLKEAGKCSNRNILIGTAISPNRLNNSIASREFNYVTPENEMKWQNVEGTENRFNFSQADAIVNWAQQNGIKVKGHCLVWHSQLAGWVNQARGRDRVLAIMKNHIEKVMEHFGNKVYAWDVVNEAIATDNDVGSGNARMRPSVFYTEIGPDYIELAFKIARDYADSHNMKGMKLYYNDYSIDADNDKSRFARTMIKGLVDKGVPIDGVGFQMHIGPPNNIPTAKMVEDNMKYYADLGLEVLISEWDINLCGNRVTKQQQLQLYYDITKACINQPKCVAITFWGLNDGESWLNGFNGSLCNGASSQSLLFNNNQKKDTYYKVLDALNGK